MADVEETKTISKPSKNATKFVVVFSKEITLF